MKRKPFMITLFKEEKEFIRQQADRLNLSMSEFIRRVSTATKLPLPGNADAILDLVKINADMARLGNLLKMMLNDEVNSIDMVEGVKTIEELITDIDNTRAIIKSKALEL